MGLVKRIPKVSQQIITPSTANQTITKGEHDGSGYVKGEPNLTPSNIVNGKSLFGVNGNVEPKQFRIFYVTGDDAIHKLEWDFPFSVITISNTYGSQMVLLFEIKDGYFGGGNYMPSMPKFTDGKSVEFYYYKNGGNYTIKVYG